MDPVPERPSAAAIPHAHGEGPGDGAASDPASWRQCIIRDGRVSILSAEGQPGGRVLFCRHDRERIQLRSSGTTVATACAAIPSRRPTKPMPSFVVAFTLTAPGDRPSDALMCSTIAVTWGAIFGAS